MTSAILKTERKVNMSNASNWLEAAVLNHFFRNVPTTSPAQIFLALYTTNPTDFDTGMEVSGGGYARQQITFAAPVPGAGTLTVSNNNSITFPKATADWTASNETVGFWGVRTAVLGGNLLAYGEFDSPTAANNGKYAVLTGDRYNVEPGIINVILSGRGGSWLQNAVLNHFFRNTPVTGASQVFLALYRTDPTFQDIGVEITYPEYNRQLVTFLAPSDFAGLSVIRNSVTIRFPRPSINIGTVAFFGIRDGLTGGNLLAFSPWSIARDISFGMEFSVDPGLLEVSID